MCDALVRSSVQKVTLREACIFKFKLELRNAAKSGIHQVYIKTKRLITLQLSGI